MGGTAGSIATIVMALTPSPLAAQSDTIRGFRNFRGYALKLYDEAKDSRQRLPHFFDGEITGRKIHVWIKPKLRSDPYSLETKVYFSREDIPFSGEWTDLAKFFPAKVFLDYGFNGNLRGRRDIVTNLSVDSETMEYALFMGNGSYYFAHFSVPKLDSAPESKIGEYFRERMENTFHELSRARLSEEDSKKVLNILTSFDQPPQNFGYSFNFAPFFLDGAAWYIPSGVLQSYLDLSLNNREMRVNVGTRPRLIGSYSRTSNAELRKRREQAFDNANRENRGIIQKTIDALVQEGKINLQ